MAEVGRAHLHDVGRTETCWCGSEPGEPHAIAGPRKPTHWTTRRDYTEERAVRFARRDAAIELVELLKSRGYTTFAPPPKPGPSDDVIWDEFNDCRIVIRYIIGVDKFRLWVDVLAS